VHGGTSFRDAFLGNPYNMNVNALLVKNCHVPYRTDYPCRVTIPRGCMGDGWHRTPLCLRDCVRVNTPPHTMHSPQESWFPMAISRRKFGSRRLLMMMDDKVGDDEASPLSTESRESQRRERFKNYWFCTP
jgi:hypothetical protein